MSVNKDVVHVNSGLFRQRPLTVRSGLGICDCCGSGVVTPDTVDFCFHRGILLGVGVNVPTTEEYVLKFKGTSSYYSTIEWKGARVELPELGISYNLLIQLGYKPDDEEDEDWDD